MRTTVGDEGGREDIIVGQALQMTTQGNVIHDHILNEARERIRARGGNPEDPEEMCRELRRSTKNLFVGIASAWHATSFSRAN